MAVGKAGGPKGGGGGAKGVSGAGSAGGASGPSSSAAPGSPQAVISAQVQELARLLKAGQISRDEATQKLVATMLKEKMRTQSRSLVKKIADDISDHPRLKRLLKDKEGE